MSAVIRVAALLAAAGSGRRLATDGDASQSLPPKAFLPLHGKPLFLHSLKVLRACDVIQTIAVVVPPSYLEEARRLLAQSPSTKKEIVLPGGDSRQASVYNGLSALCNEADYVVVHDAARPHITAQLVSDCLQAARESGAATCALPATDTVKSSLDGSLVEKTLARNTLWNIQTPQAFACSIILQAHKEAAARGLLASDDAMLVEALGRPVRLVPGLRENIKITHKSDLEMMELLARARASEAPPQLRIGLGFDVHAFSKERKLILAGLRLPGPGLMGHSDADLICHAVTDALLGAAGLGDIGAHFPDTDPQYAGASSIALLEKTREMVTAAHLRLTWLDIVVAAQSPKIAPHAEKMRQNLAAALQVDPACISLKGKTTEGLGFVGREEGLACWAVCLLQEN